MAVAAIPMQDLAISAVSYDALLAQELILKLAVRLESVPTWSGLTPTVDEENSPLGEDASRIVVVLGQRLWGTDEGTTRDAVVLQRRIKRKKKSVIVVALDREPLPAWMTVLPRVDLATAGITGVIDFVLSAIADAGGKIIDAVKPIDSDEPRAHRWPDPPTPYLGQSRAHGALRRELDALCAELEPRFDVKRDPASEHILELYKLPHRVVARVDTVGVSFSWVGGAHGTVADGRLMVIEWNGIAMTRGSGAMRTAKAVREVLYVPEATAAENWCWRMESPNGRASSSADLVGEWIAVATMSTEPQPAASVSG
jgi:hypothetical protein